MRNIITGGLLAAGFAGALAAAQTKINPTDPQPTCMMCPGHFIYLMIRIDPDKVTPLKNAEQSREYLSKPAAPSQ